MPKVGKIRLRYQGDSSVEHELHYSQKELFSIKGLSAEFLALTNFVTFGYSTENELTLAIHQAVNLYKELKTNSKLVILYKCVASPELRMNKTGETSYCGTLPGVSGNIKDAGCGTIKAAFGIDFFVAQLVSDGVTKKFYPYNSTEKTIGSHPKSNVSDYQQMDYSEEREQFFINIIESMKKMVVSVSVFFDADPEQAINIISNNPKLLSSE